MARGVDSGKSPARQVGPATGVNRLGGVSALAAKGPHPLAGKSSPAPTGYTPQPSVGPAPSPGKPIYDAMPVGGQKRAVPAGAAISKVGPNTAAPTLSSERSRQNHLFGERVGTEDDGGRGANNHLPHEIAHNNPSSRAYTQRQAPISGTGQRGDFYGAKPEVIQLAQMRVNTEKALPGLLTGDSNKTRPAAKLVDFGMRSDITEPMASEVKTGHATKAQVESAFSKQQRAASITHETKVRMPTGKEGPVLPPRGIGEVAGTKSEISARPSRRVEKQFSGQHKYDSQQPKSPKPLGSNTGGVLGRATGSMTRNTLKPGAVPKDKGISSRKS